MTLETHISNALTTTSSKETCIHDFLVFMNATELQENLKDMSPRYYIQMYASMRPTTKSLN